MTKTIRMLVVAFLCVLPLSLYAAKGDVFTAKTVEGIDMEFMVISENRHTCQVGIGGEGCAVDQNTTGAVTMPEIVHGYTVTSVATQAFSGCSGLTSITIPNSVTSIGQSAFQNCFRLVIITIPNSVTSIGQNAFYGCWGLKKVIVSNISAWCGIAFEDEDSNPLYHSNHLYSNENTEIKNLVIPDGVTDIGSSAFSGCFGLTSITIPNSVTSIGFRAFSGCRGLTSINIPNSVTSIGDEAFSGCSGLTSITIPNSVTSIGSSAFSGCFGLTSITIPNSVTGIGDHAFSGCSGLTSITIPNSVTSIGDRAFYECSGLTSITIPNSVTSIGDRAFSDCRNLSSIEIPNSVTSIGSYAFEGTRWFNKQPNGLVYAGKIAYKYKGIMPGTIELNDGTLGIAESAFDECSGLTSITIPNSVITIGGHAFYGCSGLTSITIPNSVITIGGHAFYGCSGLRSINIPNSVIIIGNYAFYGCSELKSISIPNSVITIGKYAFFNCTSLTSIVISNSVTSIGDSAFSQCSGLTSIIIPNSVTSIGDYAFSECSGLTSITIPNSVTSIGYGVFSQCGLTSIEIPNSVTSIGARAFSGCSGLTGITIPNSVTSIGNYAFSDCFRLTNINIPNSVISIGSNAFERTQWFDWEPNGLVYAGKIAYKYKGTMPANTTIELNDGTLGIAAGAFYECSGLTGITIPNSVISIGSNAFKGTQWFDNQPYGLVYAGKIAYKYKGAMPSNTTIELNDGTLGITAGAFDECSGLTGITIPNSVTTIGDNVFSGCSLKWVMSLIETPFTINAGFDAKTSLYVFLGNKEKYEATAGWNQMEIKEVPLPNFTYTTDEGIEMACSIISYDDLTCQVGDGTHSAIVSKDVKVLNIPDRMFNCDVTAIGDNAFKDCFSLISVSFPKSITSISQNLLKDCPNLSSVQWNSNRPMSSELLGHISNPNFLLYVNDKSYAPTNIQNVVVDGKIESLVLQDAASGNNFYCPKSFTANQVSYVHNYSMQSGYETCQGWETIVLPFDVVYIHDQTRTELIPFSAWNQNINLRPFWLYAKAEDGGWQAMPSIKANVPYIISMPNNPVYPSSYNISGDITFTATNAKILATNDLQSAEYDNKKFVPSYQYLEANDSIYALNVNNQWNQYTDETPANGSAFIKALRPIRPFEAYLTVSGREAAKRAIPVFSSNVPTGIPHLSEHRMDSPTSQVYNLHGQKVSSLGKGLYISKGKKVIIK